MHRFLYFLAPDVSVSSYILLDPFSVALLLLVFIHNTPPPPPMLPMRLPLAFICCPLCLMYLKMSQFSVNIFSLEMSIAMLIFETHAFQMIQ